MARTLSERGQELLEALPHYYSEDPNVHAVLRAAGLELERVEALLENIRRGIWPHLADDEHLMLSLHEAQLGLPVAPEGLTLEQRRAAVLAFAARRNVRSGEFWLAALTRLVGSENFVVEENQPGEYQLRITTPFEAGSYELGQLELLLRSITPANLDVVVVSTEGFIVGESLVGEETL